jgi:hypothetical protein
VQGDGLYGCCWLVLGLVEGAACCIGSLQLHPVHAGWMNPPASSTCCLPLSHGRTSCQHIALALVVLQLASPARSMAAPGQVPGLTGLGRPQGRSDCRTFGNCQGSCKASGPMTAVWALCACVSIAEEASCQPADRLSLQVRHGVLCASWSCLGPGGSCAMCQSCLCKRMLSLAIGRTGTFYRSGRGASLRGHADLMDGEASAAHMYATLTGHPGNARD